MSNHCCVKFQYISNSDGECVILEHVSDDSCHCASDDCYNEFEQFLQQLPSCKNLRQIQGSEDLVCIAVRQNLATC